MRFILAIFSFLILTMPEARAGFTTALTNFKGGGQQVMRFSTAGDAVDAHDGKIEFFNGLYYLYGTSYDCGYQWGVKGAPFCGFKAYSSPDMVHWTDRGFLFDARTAVWQDRCDGNTFGCYRPHVLHNARTNAYVLWINVYDNSVGYRVFTSPDPAGPFTETAVPTLAVNSGAAAAGLNNGDHDTFVDEDGTAYLAFTDWRTGGTLAIEQLDSTYLSGTGKVVKGITPGSTEAPALFRRGNRYYLTYSDPNCGYCAATGTSYRTAASPLGPWSAGIRISANSCGGQPSFVTPINLATGTAYLYGSDLWNNAAKNEALANFYWSPLSFADDGSLNPMVCQDTAVLPLAVGSAGEQLHPADLDNSSGVEGFRSYCDIGNGVARSQSFVATRTGTLTGVSFTTFQSGAPNAPLRLEIHRADSAFRPTGAALSSASFPADSLGWSPRNLNITPDIPVTAGTRYALVVKSAASQGCYGLAYNDSAPYPGGGDAYSNDGGTSFAAEKNRTLKFSTTIRSAAALSPPKGEKGARRDPMPARAGHAAIRLQVSAGVAVGADGSRLHP